MSKYVQTVGVDYGVKTRGRRRHHGASEFLGFGGHSAFLEVRNEFYKDTSSTLLVYDASDRNSFEELERGSGKRTPYGMRENTPPVPSARTK